MLAKFLVALVLSISLLVMGCYEPAILSEESVEWEQGMQIKVFTAMGYSWEEEFNQFVSRPDIEVIRVTKSGETFPEYTIYYKLNKEDSK